MVREKSGNFILGKKSGEKSGILGKKSGYFFPKCHDFYKISRIYITYVFIIVLLLDPG